MIAQAQGVVPIEDIITDATSLMSKVSEYNEGGCQEKELRTNNGVPLLY